MLTIVGPNDTRFESVQKPLNNAVQAVLSVSFEFALRGHSPGLVPSNQNLTSIGVSAFTLSGFLDDLSFHIMLLKHRNLRSAMKGAATFYRNFNMTITQK